MPQVSSLDPRDPYYEPTLRPLLTDDGRYVAINGSPGDWMRGVLDQNIAALTGKIGLVQREG